MSFFTGEYDCKLDAKGRLALPAKVKAALPDVANQELVVRRGFEQCLCVSMLEYKKIINRVRSLVSSMKNIEDFREVSLEVIPKWRWMVLGESIFRNE